MRLGAWGHQLFIACDQLANVLVGLGNDDYYADETLSAHAWRKRASRRWDVFRRFVDALFFWQDVVIRARTGAFPVERHCERAYLTESKRLGLPPEYRT